MTENTLYIYGMRLRGFSIGCQPMNGFVKRLDPPKGKYWDLIAYNRKLDEREIRAFDLDFVREERA